MMNQGEEDDGGDKPTELPRATGPRRTRSHSLRPMANRPLFFTPDAVDASQLLAAGAAASPSTNANDELMGPIIRRKKVISLPLGSDPRRSAFFGGDDVSGYMTPPPLLSASSARVRQSSGGSMTGISPHASPKRRRQRSFVQGLLGRKGVALDLAAPEDLDFFAPLVPEIEDSLDDDQKKVAPSAPGEVTEAGAKVAEGETPQKPEASVEEQAKKLFKPLRFSKPVKRGGGGGGGQGGGHGGGGGGGGAAVVDDDVRELLEIQLESQQKLQKQLDQLAASSQGRSDDEELLLYQIKSSAKEVDVDTEKLQLALGMEKIPVQEQTSVEEEMGPFEEEQEEEDASPDEKTIEKAQEEMEMMLAPIEAELGIKKATRGDFIYTGILFAIMVALTGVILGWHTEIDEEFSVFGPVGLACSSQCLGHLESQNYFRSHPHFETDNLIHLKMRLDPNPDEGAHALVQIVGAETGHTKAIVEFGPPEPEEHTTHETDIDVNFDHPHEEHIINVFSLYEGQHLTELECTTPCYGNLTSQNYFDREKSSFETGEYIQLVMQLFPTEQEDTLVMVQIVGAESQQVKQNITFGPAPHHEPEFFTRTIEVGFDDPGEEHIINVFSTNEEDPVDFQLSAYINNNTVLSFTLFSTQLKPLAKYSELIAALIMIAVYLFILLEWIHRTLVAIGGSMVALFFFFLMHGGETESIQTLMLNMEWSTLGLLFGMMVIVGELSHTGIFEWLSVRLLVASKGSYTRLMVLLCLLTAVSSAFLDNVTTMLLIAPVTIDLASILKVDPRPYLIGEVILSNVGGTATLIGDPPNIIIGSAFDEIGFIDFIIEIAPMIFLFGIPVSIALIAYLYRYYLTATKMPYLDVDKLKRTYQVYDEPRLLIAGTVAFFVILIFFMHPVHHKDTAWIALLGAFITIGFTNPHDVQDALRNHIEWDTLLFFAGLFVLVEICAHMGLLELIGEVLADYIKEQPESDQLAIAITLILWVSAITSAFLDNIPYTATMIPVVRILAEELPDTLPIKTLAWALSFGACLGGNGTLLGASANIVTAGISTTRGFEISFLNFFYPGMIVMVATVAIANIYMLCIYVWV